MFERSIRMFRESRKRLLDRLEPGAGLGSTGTPGLKLFKFFNQMPEITSSEALELCFVSGSGENSCLSLLGYIGASLAMRGNTLKALQLYDGLILQLGCKPGLYLGRANILFLDGATNAAANDLVLANTSGRHHSGASLLQGLLEFKANNPDKALRYVSDELLLQREASEALFVRAAMRYLTGDYAGALADFDACTTAWPENSFFQRGRQLVREWLGLATQHAGLGNTTLWVGDTVSDRPNLVVGVIVASQLLGGVHDSFVDAGS